MQQIKYDVKDKKIFKICAIVCTIFFLSTVIFTCTSLADELDSILFAYVIIMGTTMSPILALAFWVLFFDSATYLNRLKKYGYIVPKNKKDYDRKLDNLVSGEISSFEEPSKESTALAIISLIVAVGMLINAVVFFVRFSAIMENVSFVGVVLVIMAIAWIVIAIIFWKQRDRKNYRDDIEPVATIKVRKHIVEGLVIVIILTFLSCMGASVIYNMAKYVEKSIEMQENQYEES